MLKFENSHMFNGENNFSREHLMNEEHLLVCDVPSTAITTAGRARKLMASLPNA